MVFAQYFPNYYLRKEVEGIEFMKSETTETLSLFVDVCLDKSFPTLMKKST